MAYTSTGINTSVTIVAAAGAKADYRGKAVKFDENGNAVLAGAGEAAIGLGIITNDEETQVSHDVDIQVKEIGLGLAGGEFKRGAELTADANGMLVAAAGGNFVVATALDNAVAGKYVHVQITKYMK